ncbi:methylamine utilization protein [Alteromonas sp. 5E99-2]|uniref:methylamine utilization protein n=1 Tax=Alteromonas sp. 5E99-2 TaxID=2817683 RepID=UPI001A980C96|nr:methylamine utilization protein [Alteromonas sp. 5E99-2]MBO1256736.1 methylamine utilization protein [Alteromonas sp. 5E99-2]
MKTRFFAFFFALSSSFLSFADAVTLRVVDQNNEPVEFVVIAAKNTGDTPIPLKRSVYMDQKRRQFAPRTLAVQAGQKVIFPNSDDIQHHIYSFSTPKPFQIRLFEGGERESVVFDKPGIVVLGCNIHDNMVGYIYVAENELTTVTDETGSATIDTSETELLIWHPRLSATSTERQSIVIDSEKSEVQTLELQLLPGRGVTLGASR